MAFLKLLLHRGYKMLTNLNKLYIYRERISIKLSNFRRKSNLKLCLHLLNNK